MLAFDVETDPRTGQLICIGIHDSELSEVFEPGEVYSDMFNGPLIGHNIKSDLHVIKRAGLMEGWEEYNWYDTMVMSWLIDEVNSHELKELAVRYKLTDSAVTWKELNTKYKGDIPKSVLYPYCEKDAIYTYKLFHIFSKYLKRDGTWKWFTKVEVPLTRVLWEMEDRGIKIDQDKLQQLSVELFTKQIELFNELVQVIENPNSDVAVAHYLYDKLELPIVKETAKGAPSVDNESLKELKGLHPIIDTILNYRVVTKLLTTYILPFEGKDTLHTDFKQTGTVTGRLSSARPNLQNIPARGEYGSQIREMFVARDGYEFIIADFSQMELRMLAHLAKDKKMLKAFEEEADIHAMTASTIYGVPIDQVTKEQRSDGKTTNFGRIYGQGIKSLAWKMKIDEEKARQFHEGFAKAFPISQRWIYKVTEDCKWSNGGKKTGRIVPLPLSGRKRHLEPEEGDYKAANIIIQGSCGDIVKERMVEARELLKEWGAQIILQVHDELVIEAPKGAGEGGLLSKVVECLQDNPYRLPVEAKIATKWEK